MANRTCKLRTCSNPANGQGAEFCCQDHAREYVRQLEAEFCAGLERRVMPNVGTCLVHRKRGCIICLPSKGA